MSSRKWCRTEIIKAARREFINPPMLIPDTKRSDSIIVQAFTTKVNSPKVIMLKGNVISSRSGLSSRLTIRSTNPIISREDVSLMKTESIAMDNK
jgi:hypothetical protein